MGRIYCIIGKSASGKDSIYRELCRTLPDSFRTVVPYTTRPIRSNGEEGREYHFVTVEGFERLRTEGKIIEFRCYHTVYGDWYYFTADDGQIDIDKSDYLLIMTLEGFEALQKYYGNDHVVPIYIEVEDGLRLSRALERERAQKAPKYAEMCRRFLADSKDFAEENIERLGITRRYLNVDFDSCLKEIREFLYGNGN